MSPTTHLLVLLIAVVALSTPSSADHSQKPGYEHIPPAHSPKPAPEHKPPTHFGKHPTRHHHPKPPMPANKPEHKPCAPAEPPMLEKPEPRSGFWPPHHKPTPPHHGHFRAHPPIGRGEGSHEWPWRTLPPSPMKKPPTDPKKKPHHRPPPHKAPPPIHAY